MSVPDLAWILAEVADERGRQDEKFGEQNHPDIHADAGHDPHMTALYHGVPTASLARRVCDARHRTGHGTYADILVEEVAEAVEAAATKPVAELREELIQVAAVAVAWVECIDRRESK